MVRIPFAKPDVGRAELNAIKEVIESGWLTKGKKVRKFERRMAEISGCSWAVAFDSCTAALEMSLRVLGVGPGDEIITTPYTYSATAEVILNVGAKVVFVDLAKNSFEMDYEKVEAAITEKTKAVIPVDFGGKLCDYDALYRAIDNKKDIFIPHSKLQNALGRVAVIADAAHSFGATMGDKVSGQFADFTCFSFHVLKNITTGGEGGIVVWNNFDGIESYTLENAFRLLGDHGQTSRDKKHGWEYDIAVLGYNHIMTDIDAAMGLAQLDRFDEIRDKRIEITHRYDMLFENCCFVERGIKHFSEDYTSAMHLYPVIIEPDFPPCKSAGRHNEMYRNSVYAKLMEKGIQCNVHYKPLPMMTAYRNLGYDIADYQNAYDMFTKILTIPYHTMLTEEQQVYIVESLERAVLL